MIRPGSLLIAAACVALAAPACSDPPAPSGTVEIMSWWNKGGEAEALRALLDVFTGQHPSIEVVDSSVPGGSLETRAALANRMEAKIPPDTFQANGGWDLMTWVLYPGVEDGLLDPIDDIAQDWMYHVPPEVLASVSYDGPQGDEHHVYGVPLNIHRLNTLYYNKAVFARLGIEPDDARLKSLAGLFDVAEQIKASSTASEPITPFAFGYGQNETWTLALLFFENLLVGREDPANNRQKGDLYLQLFRAPKDGDAFSADITYALEDFRRLFSYANEDADEILWDEAMLSVLKGEAAMTIMGDWAMGYAKAAGYTSEDFGFMPMPGTAGTFVFTTDTFGMPGGASEATKTLLRVFGAPNGQKVFNEKKGSISARLDVQIPETDDRWATHKDFHDPQTRIIQATSILAQHIYIDAISAALANFAYEGAADGNASEVQHTMDNYKDVLFGSCWPRCLSGAAPAP